MKKLVIFFYTNDESVSQKDIVKTLKEDNGNINRCLKILNNNDLITRVGEGWHTEHKINKDYYLYKEVKSLVGKYLKER